MLLVDAFQGVEAQTVANAYAAMEHDLTIIPVINKIDLAYARPDEVAEEMHQTLGIDPEDCVRVSAKTGVGIEGLIKAIIDKIPAPKGDPQKTLQAMVFDSNYDDFRGAVTYVRMMNGTVKRGQKVRYLHTGHQYDVIELGQFVPQRKACDVLSAGQVGYIICNIKSLAEVHIGDTVSIQAIILPKRSMATMFPNAWSTAAYSPAMDKTLPNCAMRSKSLPLMTPALTLNRRPATRSASVSAVASWVCCTWRLCSND